MTYVLTLPFQFAFYAFKAVAALFCNVEVTARHSLVEGSFKPFKSDIDVSFFVKSEAEEGRVIKLYKVARLLFPFFGEFVLYNESRMGFLQDHLLNAYEIDRDPALKAKLPHFSGDNYYFSPSHAVSYLQAALMGDYHNLLKRPKARLAKWRFHFAHVNRNIKHTQVVLDENDIVFSILTAMLRLINYDALGAAELDRVKLGVLVDYMASKRRVVDLAPLVAAEPLLWVFFPAFCASTKAEPPRISENQLPVLLAELDRELLNILRSPDKVSVAIDSLEDISDALVDISQKNPSIHLDVQLSKVQRLLAIMSL